MTNPATVIDRCKAEGVTLTHIYTSPSGDHWGWRIVTGYSLWFDARRGFRVERAAVGTTRGKRIARGKKLATVLPAMKAIVRADARPELFS